ncbi:MAG: hypothetical protein EWV41_02090 [Microcystis wesenbergii Mw_MB_S_20031200_S109]|uniref:Uncharacterized protein n=1 Tax=Microcystis wesenbergii Mw_MB_S_20031200_S109D TaxID=2486241 RepID=A0A552LRZ3_9CHRO|nr:MAG: hypothetical protein EWV41_02090 [Microcystis wesenbergii Mw_MB_S_20031200_S109]TRV22972.1 MAG: hypothetical protein EWV88_12490 [Microcystis wesenbergii Mw_MB_S_20031200_S109D]
MLTKIIPPPPHLPISSSPQFPISLAPLHPTPYTLHPTPYTLHPTFWDELDAIVKHLSLRKGNLKPWQHRQ